MAIEYFEDGLYVSLSNITEEDIEELAAIAASNLRSAAVRLVDKITGRRKDKRTK